MGATRPYEAIVLGLGGMGSAALYYLAKQGKRVLGLEQHTAAHDLGSSHGRTRIIRQAYYEDPCYVPMILRAYELWERLEQETNRKLLTVTGGLMVGGENSPVILGSKRSAEEHGLEHEMLSADEIRRRFPSMNPSPDEIGLYEHQAGFLRPEACVQAYLERSADLGATAHFNEPVTDWRASPTGEGVEVVTSQGRYHADTLVICAGPWAPRLLADMGVHLRATRQTSHWFRPGPSTASFHPDNFPIFAWQTGDDLMYGFPGDPDLDGWVKVGLHNPGDAVTPETLQRVVFQEEIDAIQATVRPRLPGLADAYALGSVCMYTMSPDSHFVIGLHPEFQQVSIAAGFSGHGYKFASVVGEILSELALSRRSHLDITPFSPTRFC